ncbi:MAG: hypothetical protein IKK81_01600 [Prevotella sp.]|nr:hypothetical protein [Prevotella sp.]
MALYSFYKNKENDKVYWVDNPNLIGAHEFSFDKKRIFNLFRDYPWELSQEEKRIFDAENPYWVDFFKDRKKGG